MFETKTVGTAARSEVKDARPQEGVVSWLKQRSVSLAAATILSVASVAAAHGQSQSAGVQASAQGPSNVNVVNVPTVTVGNTPLQPIPVQAPLKEPVHANFSLTIPLGLAASNRPTYSVPAGKRLVIEHIAARCVSDQPNDTDIILHKGAVDLTFLATRDVPFLFPDHVVSTSAMPVQTYIDEGTIDVQAIRTTANGTTNCTTTVLGYLTSLQ